MLWLRRWALNRVDLHLGLTLIVLVTIGAVVLVTSVKAQHFLFGGKGVEAAVAAAILAGWAAIFVAAVGGLIRTTSIRRSLISLLSSEIKALQYGLSNMNMFEFWENAYRNPEQGAFGFADVPREEDYFQLFHSVSDNIGNLHPQVVAAVVRFYTYLKMSRDAAAALHSWKTQTDPSIRRVHVTYVVHLLALSMLWGFAALWFMGFKSGDHERGLLKQIATAYDTVLGTNSFNSFRDMSQTHLAVDSFFAA